MRIAICDDDKKYIDILEEYIERLKVKALDYDVYFSGEEIVKAYENKGERYDAVFLDMEMENIDGIEAANRIRKIDKQVIIVFVTSHSKYMQESFQCTPFRFLVKPLMFEEFEDVYNKVNIKFNEEPGVFIFQENKTKIRVPCPDIIFFESSGHRVLMHKKDGKTHKIRVGMTEITKLLDKDTFVRVHRAFVVNMKYVYKIYDSKIILHEYEQEIPVGITYSNDLEYAFLNFKERKYLL